MEWRGIPRERLLRGTLSPYGVGVMGTHSVGLLYPLLCIVFALPRGAALYTNHSNLSQFFSKVLLLPTFPLLGFLLSQNKIKLFIQFRVCFRLLGMCHMINATKNWKMKNKKKPFHGPISTSNWCFFLITPIFKQTGKNTTILFDF